MPEVIEVHDDAFSVETDDDNVTIEVRDQVVSVEVANRGFPGRAGDDGPSAYDVAVEEGFVGTEEEWLASLQGEDGVPGIQWVGDWNSSYGYSPNDGVYYNGSSYRATVANTNFNPETYLGTHWAYIARAGSGGGGVGGDADTLDGYDSTYFLDTSSSSETKVGGLEVQGGITTGSVDLYKVTNKAGNTQATTNDPVTFDTFNVNDYRSAEYTIQLTQGAKHLITRLIILQNTSQASITEFATVFIGDPIEYDFNADFSGLVLNMQIAFPDLTDGPVDIVVSKTIFDR